MNVDLSKLKVLVTKHNGDFTAYICNEENRNESVVYLEPYPPISFLVEKICNGEYEENENEKKIAMRLEMKPKIIYPAIEKELKKYCGEKRYRLESPRDYQEFIKSQKVVPWIDNLLKNPHILQEKTHLINKDYIIVNNTYKWEGLDSEYLYLLVFYKNENYRTLRDLDDIELLEGLKKDINCIADKLGVQKDFLCVYFHYHPSYFRLHTHIVNISKSKKTLGMQLRNVYLDTVIKNLKLDRDYYKKNTIPCVIE